MQLIKQHWRTLQTSLAIMAMVIIIVLSLLIFAQSYNTGQLQILQTQQKLLNSAREHYLSSGLEKSTINEYLPQYKALILQGFVGEERRSDWCVLLQIQQKVRKLFDIKYTLSPQQEYLPLFSENVSSLVLHRSVMSLNFDALHEADILKLLESLISKKIAPFILRDCEMTRLNKSSALNSALAANLNAKCELDWLTMHEPKVTQDLVKP